MTEKLFTVVGTAVNADGTLKVRWANDLASRVKILDKAGCTDINLIELPSGMTKLAALEYLRDNTELTDAQSEVVELKIGEKAKLAKRADVKATITKNVKTKTAAKKSDPKVEKFVEKALADAAE
jgi:hypothetical protein